MSESLASARGSLHMAVSPRRVVAFVVAAVVLLAACSDPPVQGVGTAAEADDTPVIPTENGSAPTPIPAAPPPEPDEFGRLVYDIPDVDQSISAVSPDDVIFDTFGRGPLTLGDSTEDERVALLDAIPPIDDPRYIDPASDPWLLPADLVLGFVDASGQAYAHPHKILALHEIVNVDLRGQRVLVSYCPLCDSGVVFDRVVEVEGQPTDLRFSNTSALFDNDLVMVDRSTGSYWWQVSGRAIVGELTDVELTVLPSTTATWTQWLDLHPGTVLLSRNLGFNRDYTIDRFAGYADLVDSGVTPFPVNPAALADTRLTPATRVVVVGELTETIAVPIAEQAAVASFVLAGQPIVVLVENGVGAAFAGTLEGQPLQIEAIDGRFTDSRTGVSFDLAGRSTGDSELVLEPVASRSSFWFAIAAAFPEVTVLPALG